MPPPNPLPHSRSKNGVASLAYGERENVLMWKSRRDADGQVLVALHEVGVDALRLVRRSSMLSKRFSISSQTIFSCSSARRLPTQR